MHERRLHMPQEEMAKWLGCSVEQMNAEHDKLHSKLSRWTKEHSYSLELAAGVRLTPQEYTLANLEEDAVLYLQRYLVACQRARAEVDKENG